MQNSLMQYNLNQLLAKAIMQKVPFIVVEGEDDRTFYLRMIEAEGRKADILPSEIVKKENNHYYTPGCEGVIEIVEDAQSNIKKNLLCKKYFLGIIDGDYRKYTEKKALNLECLFVLDYYSYESHFITENSVKHLLAYTTRVSMQDITNEILTELMRDTKKVMDDMYLVGLEILRERNGLSCDKLFSVDTKPEALYQPKDGVTKIDKVLEKEEELNQFAESNGISRKDIRSVVKGKYLLYAFVKAVYERIGKLSNMCRNGEIKQCVYCENDKFEHCIWKVKNKINRSEYNNVIIDVSWRTESEIEYIKDRLSGLG